MGQEKEKEKEKEKLKLKKDDKKDIWFVFNRTNENFIWILRIAGFSTLHYILDNK